MPERADRGYVADAMTENPTGSYLIPRLTHARVSDAMRHGILTCPADAPLRDAAQIMSTEHVHMILATSPRDGTPVGVLSARRLLEVILDREADDMPLAEVADPALPTISSDAPLLEAAEGMRASGSSHVLVKDAASNRISGVLSTLDVAGVLAWGEA
jgi:CBS domain-containing protein